MFFDLFILCGGIIFFYGTGAVCLVFLIGFIVRMVIIIRRSRIASVNKPDTQVDTLLAAEAGKRYTAEKRVSMMIKMLSEEVKGPLRFVSVVSGSQKFISEQIAGNQRNGTVSNVKDTCDCLSRMLGSIIAWGRLTGDAPPKMSVVSISEFYNSIQTFSRQFSGDHLHIIMPVPEVRSIYFVCEPDILLNSMGILADELFGINNGAIIRLIISGGEGKVKFQLISTDGLINEEQLVRLCSSLDADFFHTPDKYHFLRSRLAKDIIENMKGALEVSRLEYGNRLCMVFNIEFSALPVSKSTD